MFNQTEIIHIPKKVGAQFLSEYMLIPAFCDVRHKSFKKCSPTAIIHGRRAMDYVMIVFTCSKSIEGDIFAPSNLTMKGACCDEVGFS